MSKLPFTISPVLYHRSVSEKLAPNGFIVHKPKSRFGLCLALACATAFLLPFASQAFAIPSYDLLADYEGESYAVETGLSAGERMRLSSDIAEIEVYPGVFLDAASARLHCELAR